MNILKHFILLCFLAGCTTLDTISIIEPETSEISYSGNGVGAGMMLSSTMGPVGMAIGVAIDEGIKKEINENYVSSNITFAQLLNKSLSEKGDHQLSSIEIVSYGFRTVNGESDMVSTCEIKTFDKSGVETLLNNQISEEDKITLTDAKSSQSKVIESLSKCADQLVEKF